jgi:hypothetical protein
MKRRLTLFVLSFLHNFELMRGVGENNTNLGCFVTQSRFKNIANNFLAINHIQTIEPGPNDPTRYADSVSSIKPQYGSRKSNFEDTGKRQNTRA